MRRSRPGLLQTFLVRRVLTRLSDRRGLALIAALLVLVLVALFVGLALNSGMSSVRGTGLSYDEARVFNAAEAGAERALAQVKIALRDGNLSDDELVAISAPSLPGFGYDSFAVRKVGAPYVETITDGAYAGLYALTQRVDVFSQASDRGGSTSAVLLGAKARAIPIFQFGVFYEEDLEATNGPPMEFVGRVHSNHNIFLSSDNAWYREWITTPKKIYHDRKDHHRILNGVYVDNASGTSVALDFDSRTYADPEAFKAQSCARFDCRVMTDAFGVTPLRLPLPPGVPAYEVIRPREGADTEAERDVKFAWNADTYVRVDLTNLAPWGSRCSGGPPPSTPPEWVPLVTIDRGARPIPNDNTKCWMFYWRWSGFYEGRERELKDVLDIDVARLRNWVGGDADRRVEVLYIEFVLPASLNDLPQGARDEVLDATIDPAVRMVNADELPNRMTVAAEWPMYTRAHYNRTNKKPAALAGDGITMLSNAWNDGNNRPPQSVFDNCENDVSEGVPCPEYVSWRNGGGWTMQRATETWVNTAILAGHWPTPRDHRPHDPTSPYDGLQSSCYADCYGGGIENFPRFLERWRDTSNNPVTLHYKGALVSPFTSVKTTGTWNGSYYVPPRRDWWFDTDFQDPAKLPPGTPNVGHVIQTAMRDAF